MYTDIFPRKKMFLKTKRTKKVSMELYHVLAFGDVYDSLLTQYNFIVIIITKKVNSTRGSSV